MMDLFDEDGKGLRVIAISQSKPYPLVADFCARCMNRRAKKLGELIDARLSTFAGEKSPSYAGNT